jgi:hypothetical protein
MKKAVKILFLTSAMLVALAFLFIITNNKIVETVDIEYFEKQGLIVSDNFGYEIEKFDSSKNGPRYCFSRNTVRVCFSQHE